MRDLNVWCVCNGTKYTYADVRILRRMVGLNLSVPHQFWCLSDRDIPGVQCLVPREQWPGWWAKLALFHVELGPALYLDLDSVITGPLDRLLSDELSMPANWGESGHGGCQSSVMAWGRDYTHIAESFNPALLKQDIRHPHGRYGNTDYWGDQGYLTALMGDPGAGRVRAMPHVYSYRYHCADGPPADASVICFHGIPKPADAGDEWVRKARSFT